MKNIVLLFVLCLGACGVDYEGTRGECQEDGCSDDEPEDNCESSCDDPLPEVEYRFVLIDDISLVNVSHHYPGIDLDSIVLTKVDGTVFYPTNIDDFNLVSSEESMATESESVLGPPDDACQFDSAKFVSLGGQGGYVIVSFATPEIDVVIENGDIIEVHNISSRDCLFEGYENYESYSVAVGVSVVSLLERDFVRLGSGNRVKSFPVTGL